MSIVSSGLLFFFQAEDGIRDLVRSRGLGDVYKRQGRDRPRRPDHGDRELADPARLDRDRAESDSPHLLCLLYTSDAADERSSVDLGGRRIIKQKIRLVPLRCLHRITVSQINDHTYTPLSK